MSKNEKLILPIIQSLYPNIKLATSFRGVYSGTYKGISSLIKTYMKKNPKYKNKKSGFKSLSNAYEQSKFDTFLLYYPDSKPIPFVFNPSLGLNKKKEFQTIYKNESEFYDDLYIAIKNKNLNSDSKYLLVWKKKKLHLLKCDYGFNVEKLTDHNDIYYFQVKDFHL